MEQVDFTWDGNILCEETTAQPASNTTITASNPATARYLTADALREAGIPQGPAPLEADMVYGEFPRLDEFRLRSVNLDRVGPSLTLRIDLSDFPPHPLQEWVDNQCNVVQCHAQFLAVDRLILREWNPPTRAQLTTAFTGEPRTIDVSVNGPGVSLDFRSNQSVVVKHISAFTISPSGSDEGPHRYLGKLDTRRFSSVPPTYEKTFYAR